MTEEKFSIDENDPRLDMEFFRTENEMVPKESEKLEQTPTKETKEKIDEIINSPYFYYYENKKERKFIVVMEKDYNECRTPDEYKSEDWEEGRFKPKPHDRASLLWKLCKDDYNTFLYIITRYLNVCQSLILSLLSLQNHLLITQKKNDPWTLDDCVSMGKNLVEQVEKEYENKNDYLSNFLMPKKDGDSFDLIEEFKKLSHEEQLKVLSVFILTTKKNE